MKESVKNCLEALLASSHPLTTDAIVAEARKKKSPLHGEFEWDKDKAHKIYLKARAQELIRQYWIEVNSETEEKVIRTRGAVNVTMSEDYDGPRRGYVPVQRALSDEEMRAQILQRALRELDSFRRKYHQLQELADIFAAIESLSGDSKAA